MRSRSRLLACAAILLSAAACFTGEPSSNGDAGADAAVTGSGVTYYKDVAPIVQNHCQGCHLPGGIGAFPLLTYDDAHANSAMMVYETQTKKMPPWGAQNTSECTVRFPWRNNPSLSDAEIATIQAWHDGGDVAGNPADAPPPNTNPPVTDLPNSISLAPAVPYTLTTTNDYFRCFVLDPQITTRTWLSGVFVKPGNSTIVHHALIFSVPATATIPPPDDPNVPNQYTCFGSANVTGQKLVAVWAPGQQPYQYPADVGQPIDPGTKLIMQIHYHPHANATKDPDTTTFEYATMQTTPTWGVEPVLLGNYTNAVNSKGIGLENPPFSIPPNQSGVVFTMDYTEPSSIPIPIKILSVMPHMHLVGVDEKITLTRANPTAEQPKDECMVQVPSWNFDWQRAYQYDTDIASLPTIAPGDVAKIRCTYDNTMNNPWLAQSLSEQGLTQPQTVTLGETTLDEMCLGAFWLVAPAAFL